MPGQLQPLRFAAGERRHRLAEFEVLKADVCQRRERRCNLVSERRLRRFLSGKEHERFGHRQFQRVGDRQRAPAVRARKRDPQYLGAKAPAVAVGAAQVDVGEELHLDMLEAVAAAARAAPVSGVEAEGAVGIAALFRFGRARVQGADGVEGADVACRVGAGGPADGRLVHHHHVVDQLEAFERAMQAR